MKAGRVIPNDDASVDILSLVEPEPFDVMENVSAALDILKVTQAALKGCADSDKGTREAVERTMGHAIDVMGQVYSHLLTGNGGHEFDRRRPS